MREIAKIVILMTSTMTIAGCGTAVPNIQEFPNSPGDEQLLIQSIVTSIHCDIADAVKTLIDQDKANASSNAGKRQGEWLDGWGAQIALSLAVDEKSILNPNAVGMPPSPASALFTIGASATLSTDAIRTDKSNFFYTVRQLRDRAPCTTGIQPKSGAPSLLIQNDLKVGQFLFDQLVPIATGEVTLPGSPKNTFKQNVLQHEVKFEVVTSGGINPAWKLARASVNQSGTLLSGSRDRTSDLIVTFGPLDPDQNNKALAPIAENAHLIAQIGVANEINNVKVSLFP